MYKNEGFLLFPIAYPKIGMNVAKGTLIQIWKIPLYVCVHIKTIPWKFRTLNLKGSRVIYPWSLFIS